MAKTASYSQKMFDAKKALGMTKALKRKLKKESAFKVVFLSL
jgi:hypothetical protein